MIARLRALPSGAVLLERIGSDDRVYLVGGAVRDLLLGGRPSDLDLVTEADAAAMARRIDPSAQVHDRFATATFTANGFAFDVAQARRETYSRPGALPDVSPAGLREDLLRRDFTANAMAIALGGAAAGELTAAENALADLDARRLRVLHDASFIDDPTRLLRLARYLSRLGFTVEPHTAELAAAAVQADALRTVSGPRIGAELRLLARERDPVAALQALNEAGLASAIHREFGLLDPDLARLGLALLPQDGRRDLLTLAVAAVRVPAGELSELLDSLEFDAAERDRIVAAASRAREVADDLERAGSPAEIAAAVRGAGVELVALAGALGPSAQARSWLERLRHVRLDITGSDLLAAGVPEGPVIGRALRAALDAKLDGRAADREAELAHALRAAQATG